MQRFSDIIELWPKPSAANFARDLALPQATVRAWKRRDVIPSDYFVETVTAAERRRIDGVTFELLARLAARKRPAGDSAPAEQVPANA